MAKFPLFWMVPEYSPEQEKAVQITSELLARFKEVTVQDGSHLVLMAIPTKEQLLSDFFRVRARHLDYDVDSLEIDKPQRILHEIANREGIRVTDLLPGFRQENDLGTQLFYDVDSHWNPQGVDLAARIMGERIVDILSKVSWH